MLSKPLLPVQFIQQVRSDPCMIDFQSSVYEEAAHKERLEMRNWECPLSPDHPLAFRDSSFGFTVEARRTPLHLSSMLGDVLAVSEYLRMGATADQADIAGITPLYLVLSVMVPLTSVIILSRAAGGRDRKLLDQERALARLVWTARILIEQHADVNTTIDNIPLINLACGSQNWDIISLLLTHGANPSPGLESLKFQADKSRFSRLCKSIKNRPRPDRVCPCWSGKSVPDCHGREEQPYPLEFVCVCGSGRTYRRCCHSRRSFVFEKWDPESQRIMHDYDLIHKVHKDMRDGVKDAIAMSKTIGQVSKLLGIDRPTPCLDYNKETQLNLVADLVAKDCIDPAFAHAMREVDFIPRPHGRNISRHLCERMQTRWNTLVDAYILESGDPRPPKEIERAAKIGTWGGALFRVCEGVECGKAEGREIENLKLCSRCQISVYCSPHCQRSAWPTHKAVCKSEDQVEQSLPSQDAVQEHLRLGVEALSHDLQGHQKLLSELLDVLEQSPPVPET